MVIILSSLHDKQDITDERQRDAPARRVSATNHVILNVRIVINAEQLGMHTASEALVLAPEIVVFTIPPGFEHFSDPLYEEMLRR